MVTIRSYDVDTREGVFHTGLVFFVNGYQVLFQLDSGSRPLVSLVILMASIVIISPSPLSWSVSLVSCDRVPSLFVVCIG